MAGSMHGVVRGACMVGVCMVGGVHGSGMCMVGSMHGEGHA